jgi:hypothetical protein
MAHSASAQTPQTIQSQGNPIVADGSSYSADPAPIVVGDTLYLLAGRDEASPNVNDFIMPEWRLFSTKNVASKQWQHYPQHYPEYLWLGEAGARLRRADRSGSR